MNGYVVDDLALGAGLVGTGSEHQRRELSRLLRGAIDGGPTLDVPALCLAEVTAARPAVVGHLADVIAARRELGHGRLAAHGTGPQPARRTGPFQRAGYPSFCGPGVPERDWRRMMEALALLFTGIGVLAVLDALAIRFGADSRDSIGDDHRRGAALRP